MKPSDPFVVMANDIERNEGKFGGAFVIMPPNMGGDPVHRLIVSSDTSAASAVFFWNVVQAEIKAMLDKLSEQERQGAAFGRR